MNAFPRSTSTLALALLAAALLLGSVARSGAEPVGTAFTYQGRLLDMGEPASGPHEFSFQIFDVETGGTHLGPTLLHVASSTPNGLFTVKLDFGFSVFTGEKRWLEIGVRPDGSLDPFTILSPRTELTATPHAIRDGGGLRTVIVRPGGVDTAANGEILRAAVEGITTASATERWVVKLEPGIFDLGTTPLDVPSFVDLEGSGDEATVVTSAVDSTTEGTLNLAGNSEIRSIAVSNIGAGTTHVAVVSNGPSNGLSRADFFAQGGEDAYAVLCIGSSPTINGCTVIATGASDNNAAIANDSDSHPDCYNSYLGSDDSVVRQLDVQSTSLVKDCTFGGTIVAADRVELYGAVDSDGAVISGRTWTVGPDPEGSAASGTRLRNVLASITDASTGLRATVKLLPGVFDVVDTPLALTEGIHLLGSGRDVTVIHSSGDPATAVVTTNASAELSDLSIADTGAGATRVGLLVTDGTLRLSRVGISMTGDVGVEATAIQLDGGSLEVSDSTLAAFAVGDTNGMRGLRQNAGSATLSRCSITVLDPDGAFSSVLELVGAGGMRVVDSDILAIGSTTRGANLVGSGSVEILASRVGSASVAVHASDGPVLLRDSSVLATSTAIDSLSVGNPIRAANCMILGSVNGSPLLFQCYDPAMNPVP